MSFLAPLFLAGGLAIALPILFHLIRRSVKERTIFSSLMFLTPSPPRLTRRSRLEHLLLLALRCLVLALLAFGFARPFVKRAFTPTAPSETVKRIVVLLDTSASMQRRGLWTTARAKAEQIVKDAAPVDSVALYAFDRKLHTLLSFDQWNRTAPGDRLALARNRLADTKPGWCATVLDGPLTQAAELFSDPAVETSHGLKRIVVISDFQEGTRVSALQGHEWPGGIEVVQDKVAAQTANAGLQLLTEMADTAVTSQPAVRVRVSNASDSKREQFRVGWTGPGDQYVVKPVDLYVPAGQSRVLSLPTPPEKLAATRILLRGDEEPFDNGVWTIPPTRSEFVVLYWGSDLEGETTQPLFFLQRAFQDTQRQSIRVVRCGPSAQPSQAQAEAPLWVVTSALNDSGAAVLREALAEGKIILLAPKDPEAGAVLGKILELDLPPVREHKSSGYAMLAGIQFEHRLFAPFADSRFSDFTKIHFWSYRKMDFASLTNAQTLAQFDNGDPYIVEIPVAASRIFVFTSGWHPSDSQLALSSKFVPLLYSMLEFSAATPPPPVQHFVGAGLPAGALLAGATGPLKLVLPGGSVIVHEPGGTNFTAIEPGVYSVSSGQAQNRFVVNLEPAESRTAALAGDELERLGVPGPASAPLAGNEPARKVRLQNAELEARQKLWRWFLVVTLAVLAMETWLAGRTARRAVVREEVQ